MQSADLYLRISDDPTGQMAGVQRQETECRLLAESIGLEIRHVWTDNDISATTGRLRPGFEGLLQAKPPAIIVWHTDRLVRVTRDLERVIELGVNVYAVTASHLDLSTPAGRAVARTITAWATYEGEQKALRQKAAHRQRVGRGRPWWSHRPFGYNLDRSLHPEESEALRAAYSALLAGTPLSRIASRLNELGLITNQGHAWRGPTLRPVLLNARNAGILVYENEEMGKGDWEPIVSEETYRSVVRLLESDTRKKGGGGPRQYLLTGVALCGSCGGRVRSRTRKRYRIYSCENHCVSHRGEWLDQYVSSIAVARLEMPDANSLLATDDHAAEAVRAELVDARARLDELTEDYADRVIDRARFRWASERLQGAIQGLEERLGSLTGGSPLEGLTGPSVASQKWPTLSVDQQRAVVLALFQSIVLLPRGRGVRAMRPEHVKMEWRTP